MEQSKNNIETSINNTSTDVINRLHLLDVEDRYSFLIEHLETLCYTCNEDDLLWLEYKQYKKKRTTIVSNYNYSLDLILGFNAGYWFSRLIRVLLFNQSNQNW